MVNQTQIKIQAADALSTLTTIGAHRMQLWQKIPNMIVTAIKRNNDCLKEENSDEEQTCWTYEAWDNEALQPEIVESNDLKERSTKT